MNELDIPNREEVARRLQDALDRFILEDRWLLENAVSERAVSHRLAVHLEAAFRGWHVDCEYNRIGAAIKALDPPPDAIAWDDDEAKTVFPDIIVHQRGEAGPNVLVVEMKKAGAARANFDRDKLRAFTIDLQYHFAAFVRFTTGEGARFLPIEWFTG